MTPAHRAREVIAVLRRIYPDAHCELDHEDPFQLLVATILSAQCTDKRVNLVTPELFARYPTARDMAGADLLELEGLIRSTGFFRSKAKNIIGAARVICEEYGGVVPGGMDELTALPGVGRKTANVVLSNAYRTNAGVVVDTHVSRLSQRLGLTRQRTPERIEADLMKRCEREDWGQLSHWLIWHGRRCCTARNPQCVRCQLHDLCPSAKE